MRHKDGGIFKTNNILFANCDCNILSRFCTSTETDVGTYYKSTSVPNGMSSANIECAFRLMKSHSSSFARIAEGSGNCEQLTNAEVIDSAFEEEFEYFEKSTLYDMYDPLVRHYYFINLEWSKSFHFFILRFMLE